MPIPNTAFPDEIFYVSRKVSENPIFIEIELAVPFDVEGVQLPRRQVIAGTCQWVYRDRRLRLCRAAGAGHRRSDHRSRPGPVRQDADRLQAALRRIRRAAHQSPSRPRCWRRYTDVGRPTRQIAAALAHAAPCQPLECCGVIADGAFVPLAQPRQRARQLRHGHARLLPDRRRQRRIEAIVHSHVNLPPIASETDRAMCEKLGLPWLIVSWPSGDWR